MAFLLVATLLQLNKMRAEQCLVHNRYLKIFKGGTQLRSIIMNTQSFKCNHSSILIE